MNINMIINTNVNTNININTNNNISLIKFISYFFFVILSSGVESIDYFHFYNVGVASANF